MTKASDRLGRLPAYAMNELAAAKRAMIERGADVIDLSAGDADFLPPQVAIDALRKALGDPGMSRYGFQAGLSEFREAIVRYMQRRFGVALDPATEVLPLIGSKDGIAHLPLAILNPGDVCVVPDPGYPAYVGGAILAEADLEYVPLRADRHFLLELEELPVRRAEATRLVFLNYPNNPTTAVAPLDYLERTVAFCRTHGTVLGYDNPYCDITFDGYRAPSILEVEGAKDIAVEFHSLSKSFCMTGWRLGWAAGSAKVIAALAKAKSYLDTGPFLAVQKAGAAVLDAAETLASEVRDRFHDRRNMAVEALGTAGLAVSPPQATMYLWIPAPPGWDTNRFARVLLEEEGVMILPGGAFGEAGNPYFRIALIVPSGRLNEAAERIGRVIARTGVAGAKA